MRILRYLHSAPALFLLGLALTCCISCGTEKHCPSGTEKSGGTCQMLDETDVQSDWSLPFVDIAVDDTFDDTLDSQDGESADTVDVVDAKDQTPQDADIPGDTGELSEED